MADQSPETADAHAGQTAPSGTNNGDRWLGIVLLAICAGLYHETFFFKTFDWDPVGMAFWPRVLLTVLAGGVSMAYLQRK